jgi:hypothetical protein
MPWEELRRQVGDYLRGRGGSVEAVIDEHEEAGEGSPAAREVIMYMVGTGSYPNLERMIGFLSGVHDVPITLVSYEVFQIGDRHKILVRELTEPEAAPSDRRPSRTVDELCAQAEKNGIGDEFRMILDAAGRHGIHPRPYRGSMMYTPPSNRMRMLFTVRTWTQADGLLQLYAGPRAFAEFYPVAADEAAGLLGEAGWQHMSIQDAERFVANLDRLFAQMGENGDLR